ncbi:MAG: hypothetical protein WCR78_06855 [Arcobacteraceae bacterium]|nr:hypothetical protein [Campylobacterales bacterium]
MKNKLYKIIPLISIVLLYSSLVSFGKEDFSKKNNDIKIEQLQVKQIASQEILKKIAQHEIETSWINSSIISVEKDTSNTLWIIIFKNNENNLKDKKLNISINLNGDIVESKLI